MKTFGYPAALLGDLHNAKIELLQFDEGGQVLVQCIPMPDNSLRQDLVPVRWWAH